MLSTDTNDKLARVRWRCRRGMLELDLMLQAFCDEVYSSLGEEKQRLFEELLEEADQDLQRWLVGGQACDQARFQDMLLVIRHMHTMANA